MLTHEQAYEYGEILNGPYSHEALTGLADLAHRAGYSNYMQLLRANTGQNVIVEWMLQGMEDEDAR